MNTAHRSALGERNSLTIVVEHVFNLHLIALDAENLVPAIHNVSLAPDEHGIAVRQKNTFLLAGFIGKAKKLERDWRRWRWGLRANESLRLHYWMRRLNNRSRRSLCLKNVPSTSSIFCTFTVLKQISSQRWIKRRRKFPSAAPALIRCFRLCCY